MSAGTKLYFNVNANNGRGSLVTSDGAEIGQDLYPEIFYKSKPLIWLQLVTAYDPDTETFTEYTGLGATSAMLAAIDDDYDHDTDVMCLTLDDDINAVGDWEDGEQADISHGQISIRLDANTATFLAAVGDNAQNNSSRFEIQFYDVDSNIIKAISFPFIANNLMYDTEGTPPEVPGDYYTKVEADARYVRKTNINTGSGTIANDYVLATGISPFYGQLIVTCEDPATVGIFRVVGNTIIFAGAGTEFSLEQDNAGTINVYFAASNLIIQNKTGESIAVHYAYINPKGA